MYERNDCISMAAIADTVKLCYVVCSAAIIQNAAELRYSCTRLYKPYMQYIRTQTYVWIVVEK